MDLPLPSADTTTWWLRLLSLGCLALVMGDAALDKFRDWSGNANYVRVVFEKSVLRPIAVPLLGILAALMTGAALGSIGGILQLLVGAAPTLGWLGAVFSALTFLGLLFGLQIGKNHEAAKGVVVYLVVSLLALAFLRP